MNTHVHTLHGQLLFWHRIDTRGYILHEHWGSGFSWLDIYFTFGLFWITCSLPSWQKATPREKRITLHPAHRGWRSSWGWWKGDVGGTGWCMSKPQSLMRGCEVNSNLITRFYSNTRIVSENTPNKYKNLETCAWLLLTIAEGGWKF